MKCNMKTTVKIGAALIVLLAIAYAALPQIRPLVASASPFLLVLLCPLSMLLMMKSMQPNQQQSSVTAEQLQSHATHRRGTDAE